MELIKIEQVNGVDVVDSRTVATELGIQHKNLLETIEKYTPEIEGAFGAIAFETREFKTSQGNKTSERSAHLTEDQAIFVATLSRNSQQVVQFKARLVQAFQAARKFIQQVTEPMDDAEFIAMALQKSTRLLAAAETRAKLAERKAEVFEAQVIELQPMANYAAEVLDADRCYTATEIASQLGKSAQWLNKQLSARKIIRYVNGTWVITANFADRGFHKFRTKLGKDKDGNPKSYTDMLYTETGRQHIHGLFNPKMNPTPPIKAVA